MLFSGKDLTCQIKIFSSPLLQTLFGLFLLFLKLKQHMGNLGVNGGHGQFVILINLPVERLFTELDRVSGNQMKLITFQSSHSINP